MSSHPRFPSGTPWNSFLQTALDTNPLAQAVRSIFDSLHTYPFSTTIKIASLPLYIQLPLPPATTDSGWSYWENHSPLGEDEEEDLSSSSGEWNPTRLARWKTILLLDPVDYAGTAAGAGARRVSSFSRRESTAQYSSTEVPDEGGSGHTKSRTTSGTFTHGRRSWEASGIGAMLGMTGSMALHGAGAGGLATPQLVETPTGSATPMQSSREGTLNVYDAEEDMSEEEKSPVFRMFKDAIKPNLRSVRLLAATPLLLALSSLTS